MSISATAHATDQDLKNLGLLTKGNIISLKRYCQEMLKDKEQEERQNNSKRKLEASSDSQLFKKRKKDEASEKAPKKTQLGWLHFDEEQKRFVAVRQTKGGGTRDTHFALDATADEIIEMAKTLFYPGGFSCFGDMQEMEFSLANYKQ